MHDPIYRLGQREIVIRLVIDVRGDGADFAGGSGKVQLRDFAGRGIGEGEATHPMDLKPTIVPTATDGGAAVRLTQPDTSPMTFADALREYDEDMQLAEIGERHRKEDLATLTRAARHGGWTDIRDFTQASVRAYLLMLTTKGREAKTRKLYWEAMDRFARWCVKRSLLAENPVRAVPKPKVTPHQSRYVPTDDEVARVIRAATQDRRKRDEWLVLLTAAGAGPRWKALYLLEKSHINLSHDKPHIDLPPHLSKNRRRRIYPLTPELAGHLRDHLARIGGRIITKKYSGHAITAPFVFERVPKHLNFMRTLLRAGLAVKLPDGTVDNSRPGGLSFSFHSLRHYFSNRKYRLGYTPEQRRAALGHETLSMTMDVYTDESLLQVAEKIRTEPPLLAGFTPPASEKRQKMKIASCTEPRAPISCISDSKMNDHTSQSSRITEDRTPAASSSRFLEVATHRGECGPQDSVVPARLSAALAEPSNQWAIQDLNLCAQSGHSTSSADPRGSNGLRNEAENDRRVVRKEPFGATGPQEIQALSQGSDLRSVRGAVARPEAKEGGPSQAAAGALDDAGGGADAGRAGAAPDQEQGQNGSDERDGLRPSGEAALRGVRLDGSDRVSSPQLPEAAGRPMAVLAAPSGSSRQEASQGILNSPASPSMTGGRRPAPPLVGVGAISRTAAIGGDRPPLAHVPEVRHEELNPPVHSTTARGEPGADGFDGARPHQGARLGRDVSADAAEPTLKAAGQGVAHARGPGHHGGALAAPQGTGPDAPSSFTTQETNDGEAESTGRDVASHIGLELLIHRDSVGQGDGGNRPRGGGSAGDERQSPGIPRGPVQVAERDAGADAEHRRATIAREVTAAHTEYLRVMERLLKYGAAIALIGGVLSAAAIAPIPKPDTVASSTVDAHR